MTMSPRLFHHLAGKRRATAALMILCGLLFGPLTRAADKPDLLKKALQGPLSGSSSVVFTARKPPADPHWYANFGYYGPDENRKAYTEGGQLCKLQLKSGKVTVLLDDPKGTVRDPQLHYNGKKILFSYRPGGTEYFHLYEIGIDGEDLRQLTEGPFDDIEPTYLPDGGIMFASSRCKRWVKCWLVNVAIIYRCDGDGSNIRPVSSAQSTENTPWVMPDGRVLYTRWEYVDRSQVSFHHLWTMNPDGTNQAIFFGNLHPGVVMIDAKPIPGTRKVLSIFSPGHGRREHTGAVTVVDPSAGPHARGRARRISKKPWYRDPYPLTEDLFLVARGSEMMLMDEDGRIQTIHRLPEKQRSAKYWLHEPRPIRARPREPVMPHRVEPSEKTGKLIVKDIYHGMRMEGVKRGEIEKLLVLESLPKPVSFTGGMGPISRGGTFSLERVVGTVPVEPDGSVYMELPALRSFFFVALDKNDMSVKREQSFVTVQPGEMTTCNGCHTQQTQAPRVSLNTADLQALREPPDAPKPIEDAPEVFDYPRDVQPILNDLCVDCHGYEKTDKGGPYAGKVVLAGDHGPIYSHSYYMMTTKRVFTDGRNTVNSNQPPRSVGSGASRIFDMIDGSHYGVKASDRQKKLLRLWIDSGAVYAGTYAALGSGMLGGHVENKLVNSGTNWPEVRAGSQVIRNRCMSCHTGGKKLPLHLSGGGRGRFSRHVVFNLSRPSKSLVLLAPLSKDAGGFGLCREKSGKAAEVFKDKQDPGYQKLLAMCRRGHQYLQKVKRFDMEGFRPNRHYMREMQRFNILPNDLGPDVSLDPYDLDRKYWKSLWYRPEEDHAAK